MRSSGESRRAGDPSAGHGRGEDRTGELLTPMALPSPGRALPYLPRNASCHRGPPANPNRLGTLAGRRPHRDHDDHGAHGRRDGHGLNPVSSTPTASTAAASTSARGSHQGLLEPDALKGARPVLRRAGPSNGSGLSDISRRFAPADSGLAGWCRRDGQQASRAAGEWPSSSRQRRGTRPQPYRRRGADVRRSDAAHLRHRTPSGRARMRLAGIGSPQVSQSP